jgi:hypothetical protein
MHVANSVILFGPRHVGIRRDEKVDVLAKEYGGYSLPKIQPLNLDNSCFGSNKKISDMRVTYCTGIKRGIKRFDYLDLTK